jgi:Arc/MetJ-type ribon-helix-helix transcriptional regulator
MSVPVTTRLDESVVTAVDSAVAAGLAPNRGSVIATAVNEWLARHAEDAITLSYRNRYDRPDPNHDQLVAAISRFAAAACLAHDER